MGRSVFLCLLFLLPIAHLFGCAGTVEDSNGTNNAEPTANGAANAEPTRGMPEPQYVRIASAGDVEIVGTYYPPLNAGSPAILFLHQWYSDRSSFDRFAREMQREGFAALAIDGRGFGESNKTKDEKTVEVLSSAEAFKSMLADVDSAFGFLSRLQDVDPKRIAIVGASYGSSQAIVYAADHDNVKAAALLSPGLNYFNTMPTGPAAARYVGRPLMLVTSEGDKDSALAVREMMRLGGEKGNTTSRIYSGKAHGTDIFDSEPGLTEDLKEFLRENV